MKLSKNVTQALEISDAARKAAAVFADVKTRMDAVVAQLRTQQVARPR